MRHPKGSKSPWKSGHTRIVITLSDSTFKRVLARAKAKNKWFSEITEDIIKCGLLCLEESELEDAQTNVVMLNRDAGR